MCVVGSRFRRESVRVLCLECVCVRVRACRAGAEGLCSRRASERAPCHEGNYPDRREPDGFRKGRRLGGRCRRSDLKRVDGRSGRRGPGGAEATGEHLWGEGRIQDDPEFVRGAGVSLVGAAAVRMGVVRGTSEV